MSALDNTVNIGDQLSGGLTTVSSFLGNTKYGNILGTAGTVLGAANTAIGTAFGTSFTDTVEDGWNLFKGALESSVGVFTGNANLLTLGAGDNKETATFNFKFKQKSPEDRLYDSPLGPNRNNVPNILGMPFSYTYQSDPKARVYNRTFMQDLPIVTFVPGLPKFNGGLQSLLKGLSTSNEASVAYLASNGIGKSWFDQRYYSFKPSYAEYYSNVNTMLATLHLRMGLSSKFNTLASASNVNVEIPGVENPLLQAEIYEFSQDVEDRERENPLMLGEQMSISFFVEDLNSGSITENTSSSYGSSQIASVADSNSALLKEINYVTGSGGDGLLDVLRTRAVVGEITKTMQSLTASGGDTVAGLIGQTNSSVLKALRQSQNGMQLMFPEIWQDTDHTRSINLNFKFFSPYGDPVSIFNNVYVPFVALLGLALPRQAGEMGYISPLLVRVDIPGQFTVDMGVITDMTFTKGGSENLWTKDGYPRVIECSVTIKDLYPALMMTKRMNYLQANPGYSMFIDNMAGISARLNKYQLNMSTYLTGWVNRMASADDTISNIMVDAEARLYENLNTKGLRNMVGSMKETLSPDNILKWFGN